MSDTQEKLGAHEVAAWLRRHPTFLKQFPDLALSLVVPRDDPYRLPRIEAPLLDQVKAVAEAIHDLPKPSHQSAMVVGWAAQALYLLGFHSDPKHAIGAAIHAAEERADLDLDEREVDVDAVARLGVARLERPLDHHGRVDVVVAHDHAPDLAGVDRPQAGDEHVG